MLQKIFLFIKERKFWSALIAIIVIGIVYYACSSLASASTDTIYSLSAVEKGTITTSVSGSGQVSVISETSVQPKASGQITKINVKVGDEVKSGDVIASIDSIEAQRSVRDAELSLESAEISLEQLKKSSGLSLLQLQNSVDQATNEWEQAKDEYEQQILESSQSVTSAYEDAYDAMSDAFLVLPDIMEHLKEAHQNSNMLAYKNALGEKSVLISSFDDAYLPAKKAYDAALKSFKLISRTSSNEEIYALTASVYDMTKQFSDLLKSAKNIFDKLLNDDEYVPSTIESLSSSVDTDITEINNQVNSLRTVKDDMDSAEQDSPYNLQKAEDAVTSAQQSLQEKMQDLENAGTTDNSLDIRAQEISVEQRQNSLADAYDELSNYTVRAPYDGFIAELSVAKGDTVSSGTSIVTLVTQQKIVEISLNEVDVANVTEGQQVTLTFDAIEDLEMTGKVAQVDILGTVESGVASYTVEISLDSQDDRIKAGMSASASIITEVKQDILIVPNGAIKSNDDVSYVEVVAVEDGVSTTTKTPTNQTVETGLVNDDYTEIVSGLNEGDMVVVKTVVGASSSSSSSSKSDSADDSKASSFGILGGAAGAGAGGPPPG